MCVPALICLKPTVPLVTQKSYPQSYEQNMLDDKGLQGWVIYLLHNAFLSLFSRALCLLIKPRYCKLVCLIMLAVVFIASPDGVTRPRQLTDFAIDASASSPFHVLTMTELSRTNFSEHILTLRNT